MKELLAQEQSIESMYLYDLVKLMAGDQTVAKTICSQRQRPSWEAHAAMTMLFCLDEAAVMDVKGSKQTFVT